MYYEEMQKKVEELKKKDVVRILAIESSCDETSISVVVNGRDMLSNVIASQIEIHKQFGGVVPEVASRNHIQNITSCYKEALEKANITEKDIDAIAVTYGAGLMGALLVGVNYAKTLAFSLNIPLIAVSHIEGHIASNYITYKDLKPPFVCLMVSGGHTAILDVYDYNKHNLIGTTIDDAVGEAFDKVARVLGLPYPGGPVIDKLAKQGKSNIVFTHSTKMKTTNDFSFSGIKTAVINYVHNRQQKNEEIVVEDVCASFQTAVVDELAEKTVRSCINNGQKKLVCAGGVSANSFLKERLKTECEKYGIELYMPELRLCTDNAAMIGSAAYYYLLNGENISDLSLTAKPTVKL